MTLERTLRPLGRARPADLSVGAMRIDARTVDIPTVGVRVQLLNTTDRVRWIRFHARNGNTGAVYVGDSNVSSTRGRELTPNATAEFEFRITREGSVAMNVWYADTATNGNDVDWEAILA